jgi:hypothetical protein
MYISFTARARQVLQLANQEAQRYNHEYIGTEHLLLGLVKEGTGVAAMILSKLDIDVHKVRLEVMKIVQPAPDRVTLGVLPQTPRTKKAIEYAIEEARAGNLDHVGTRHLLLGLLREGQGVAAQVLINLGLRLDDVRAALIENNGSDMIMTEIEEGLPPIPANQPCKDLPLAKLPSIRAPEPTAMDVFFAWEKLRLFYNAIMILVTLGLTVYAQANPLAAVVFVGEALLANICFSVGPIVEGYACWFGLPREYARWCIFTLGCIVTTALAVNHVPRALAQFVGWG